MGKQTEVTVSFDGNMQIAAHLGDLTVPTDQPVKDGGDGTAPSPFDLFIASLATCAGVYAQRFCEARKLSTKGLGIHITNTFAEKGFAIEQMDFSITLPDGFPEKYEAALLRSIDLCTVKKHVMHPPEFSLSIKK